MNDNEGWELVDTSPEDANLDNINPPSFSLHLSIRIGRPEMQCVPDQPSQPEPSSPPFSQPYQPQPQSHFLSLPIEVRSQIWSYFKFSGVRFDIKIRMPASLYPLLFISRQTHAEIEEAIYTRNLSSPLGGHVCAMLDFLGPRRRSLVQNFTFHYSHPADLHRVLTHLRCLPDLRVLSATQVMEMNISLWRVMRPPLESALVGLPTLSEVHFDVAGRRGNRKPVENEAVIAFLVDLSRIVNDRTDAEIEQARQLTCASSYHAKHTCPYKCRF